VLVDGRYFCEMFGAEQDSPRADTYAGDGVGGDELLEGVPADP
jgi:hypothetical protein